MQFRMLEGYDHSYFYVASVIEGSRAVARGEPLTVEPRRPLVGGQGTGKAARGD